MAFLRRAKPTPFSFRFLLFTLRRLTLFQRIAPASAAAAAVAPVPPPDAGAPRRSRPKGGASRNVAGSTAPPVPPSAPDPAQSNGARVPPKEKEELPFADAARDSDGIEVIAPDAGAVARARSMTAKARESEANNAAYTRHEDSYVEDDALPSQQEAPDAPSSDYHDDHSLPRAAGHRASGIAHATATSHPQRSGAVKSEAIGAVKSEAIDNDARRSSLVPKDYQTFLETLANPKYCPFSIPYGQKTTGLQSSLIALQRAGLSIFNTQYMMTKLGELLAKFAAELDVDAGKPTGNKHTYVLLGSGSEQAARILKDLQDNSRATARRAAPPPNQQRLKAQDLVLANNSSYQPVQPHDSDADADVESRDHDRSQHTSSKRRTTEKRKKESAAPSSSAGPLRKASADADVESEDASSGAVKGNCIIIPCVVLSGEMVP